MIMEKAKKVTIDDLAVMMKNSFDSVDEKFKGIDEKFESVKQDIGKAKQDVIDYVDKRVGKTEGNIISKINTLTNILEEKNVISGNDVRRIRLVGAGK